MSDKQRELVSEEVTIGEDVVEREPADLEEPPQVTDTPQPQATEDKQGAEVGVAPAVPTVQEPLEAIHEPPEVLKDAFHHFAPKEGNRKGSPIRTNLRVERSRCRAPTRPDLREPIRGLVGAIPCGRPGWGATATCLKLVRMGNRKGSPLPRHDEPATNICWAPLASALVLGSGTRSRLLRTLVACLLLLLLSTSSILLWRDVTDTHLVAYSIDPGNGQVLTQQDFGGGYQGKSAITTPATFRSSIFFGIQTYQTAAPVKQQVLALTDSNATWQIDHQFSAPLTHGSLSIAPNGYLVVEAEDGLRVMTAAGHLLWQVQGRQPAGGAHAFQPTFDERTLYTLKAGSSGEVAAYNLQSGTLRWTQILGDTLNYAAPLVLNGDVLFIASDHNIYALNRKDGSLLWERPEPARTLLLLNKGEHPLLVAAGAHGLTAFDVDTGARAWLFQGEPGNDTSEGTATLTPAQFYQAAFASTGALHVVYATGIAWDTQQVRQQLWLYAVDASTGLLRWSKRIGTGLKSADAGRVFTPLADAEDGIVVLQFENESNDHVVAAFDARNGSLRWSANFAGVTATSPALIRTSNGALLLLSTASSSSMVLRSWSPTRLLLMIAIGLSGLGLLLLWILPFRVWVQRVQHTIKKVPRHLISPLKLLLCFWRFSHRLFALVFLLLLVSSGILEYAHLNQPQSGLYQVALPAGTIQWQHASGPLDQAVTADAQGSILDMNAGKDFHQLAALDQNGALLWKSFASEGKFSFPVASSQPGTVLMALSGQVSLNYQFAPDDPAYQRPLDHLFTLSLLKRRTGQIIWQSIIVNPDEQQDAVVLGADASFIYVASLQTNASPGSSGLTAQLLAVDQSTGAIEWRVFGPAELNSTPDYGALLVQGHQVIWQVKGNLYAIDTTLGQIQWRQYVGNDDAQTLLSEESRMGLAAGVLLVERSDMLHGLDLSSGNELWILPNPYFKTSGPPRGIAASGKLFLVYGDSFLEAIDATTRQIVWKFVDAVQQLRISDDGTLVYAVLVDALPGDNPSKVVAALDIRTGALRWTFQPPGSWSLAPLHPGDFQYIHNRLFVTVCFSSASQDAQQDCTHEGLYVLNASTGATLWKFDATRFFKVCASADGSIVLFQAASSEWNDFVQRFKR